MYSIKHNDSVFGIKLVCIGLTGLLVYCAHCAPTELLEKLGTLENKSFCQLGVSIDAMHLHQQGLGIDSTGASQAVISPQRAKSQPDTHTVLSSSVSASSAEENLKVLEQKIKLKNEIQQKIFDARKKLRVLRDSDEWFEYMCTNMGCLTILESPMDPFKEKVDVYDVNKLEDCKKILEAFGSKINSLILARIQEILEGPAFTDPLSAVLMQAINTIRLKELQNELNSKNDSASGPGFKRVEEPRRKPKKQIERLEVFVNDCIDIINKRIAFINSINEAVGWIMRVSRVFAKIDERKGDDSSEHGDIQPFDQSYGLCELWFGWVSNPTAEKWVQREINVDFETCDSFWAYIEKWCDFKSENATVKHITTLCLREYVEIEQDFRSVAVSLLTQGPVFISSTLLSGRIRTISDEYYALENIDDGIIETSNDRILFSERGVNSAFMKTTEILQQYFRRYINPSNNMSFGIYESGAIAYINKVIDDREEIITAINDTVYDIKCFEKAYQNNNEQITREIEEELNNKNPIKNKAPTSNISTVAMLTIWAETADSQDELFNTFHARLYDEQNVFCGKDESSFSMIKAIEVVEILGKRIEKYFNTKYEFIWNWNEIASVLVSNKILSDFKDINPCNMLRRRIEANLFLEYESSTATQDYEQDGTKMRIALDDEMLSELPSDSFCAYFAYIDLRCRALISNYYIGLRQPLSALYRKPSGCEQEWLMLLNELTSPNDKHVQQLSPLKKYKRSMKIIFQHFNSQLMSKFSMDVIKRHGGPATMGAFKDGTMKPMTTEDDHALFVAAAIDDYRRFLHYRVKTGFNTKKETSYVHDENGEPIGEMIKAFFNYQKCQTRAEKEYPYILLECIGMFGVFTNGLELNVFTETDIMLLLVNVKNKIVCDLNIFDESPDVLQWAVGDTYYSEYDENMCEVSLFEMLLWKVAIPCIRNRSSLLINQEEDDYAK